MLYQLYFITGTSNGTTGKISLSNASASRYKADDNRGYEYLMTKADFNSAQTYVSGAFSFIERKIDCKSSSYRLSYISGLLPVVSTKTESNLYFNEAGYYSNNHYMYYQDLTLNLGAISIAYGNSNTVQTAAIQTLILIKF